MNVLDYRFRVWQKAWMQSKQRMQGRWIGAEEIDWLRGWIEDHRQWSRKRIARELCGLWEWRDARGRLKDFAARSLLIKLEAQGQLRLPQLRLYNRRARPVIAPLAQWEAPPPWEDTLREIGAVRVEVIQPGTADARQWGFYLDRYHYLGLRVVGENLGYLVRDAQGRDLACLERDHFAGTCYRAANWRCVGQTRGRSRQDREHTLQVPVKDVYLYDLGAKR